MGKDNGDIKESKKSVKDYFWKVLGHGSYNRVWKSTNPSALLKETTYQGPWILKNPIKANSPVLNAMNDPKRSVRLWNEINPSLLAGLHKSGWVAPFLDNTRPSTDEETAQKCIEIYKATRRIVVDAASQGNFLTHKDSKEVRLVDMDLALKRTNSQASLDFSANLDERFESYWSDKTLLKTMPKSIEVTRNLLFLEDNLSSDLIDGLCNVEHMNLKNIQSLTWLRLRKIPLTIDIFIQLAVFNATDVTISDTLYGAICNDRTNKNKPSQLKFFPENSDQKLQAAQTMETTNKVTIATANADKYRAL